MKDGFIKVAAVTPKIRVADPVYNRQAIIEKIDEAEQQRAAVVVFPELCITGYTCGDLFLMEPLLEQAEQVLLDIAAETNGKNMLVFVGLPFAWKGRLYNVAAALERYWGWCRKPVFPVTMNFMRDAILRRGWSRRKK